MAKWINRILSVVVAGIVVYCSWLDTDLGSVHYVRGRGGLIGVAVFGVIVIFLGRVPGLSARFESIDPEGAGCLANILGWAALLLGLAFALVGIYGFHSGS